MIDAGGVAVISNLIGDSYCVNSGRECETVGNISLFYIVGAGSESVGVVVICSLELYLTVCSGCTCSDDVVELIIGSDSEGSAFEGLVCSAVVLCSVHVEGPYITGSLADYMV